jgi:hypothetical protein
VTYDSECSRIASYHVRSGGTGRGSGLGTSRIALGNDIKTLVTQVQQDTRQGVNLEVREFFRPGWALEDSGNHYDILRDIAEHVGVPEEWKTVGTESGRLSASEPNIANTPKPGPDNRLDRLIDSLTKGQHFYYDGAWKKCKHCGAEVGPGKSVDEMSHGNCPWVLAMELKSE